MVPFLQLLIFILPIDFIYVFLSIFFLFLRKASFPWNLDSKEMLAYARMYKIELKERMIDV